MKKRNTFNLSFVCRESKKNRNGVAPVELVININGDRTYVTLPRKEVPSAFAKNYASKRCNETKDFCNAYYNKCNGLVTEIISSGRVLTSALLKDYLVNGCNSVYTTEDMFGEYLKIVENKKNITYPTYKKYELCRDLFFTLVDKKKECSLISHKDILDFDVLVKNKFKESTAASYMTKLKSFINYAINNDRMRINPFCGIKISKPSEDIKIISMSDYEVMKRKKITIERLNKVRDLMILACNSGMSYCDIIDLKKEDFTTDTKGNVVVDKCRIKTGVRFYSVILNDGIKVLEKYNYDISALKLSNQKVNSYLKEIADICNVTSVESLHFHLFRHFYITRLIKSGVPIAVVQKCAGHSNPKMTMRYTHLELDDISLSVKKHIS